MAKLPGIHKSKANLNQLMAFSQDAIMSRLNCHNVGKIIDFDKNTQTCTVQLMQLKQFQNVTESAAPLTEVPLIIYGCENAHITLPDVTGSICLIFFCDRNIDTFLQTGEQYAPKTTRKHDFTDCIAITTFKTLINPIPNYDENAISIFYQKTIEEIAYTAVIKNYANRLLMQVSTNTNTSQIEISDLIQIKNGAQSLAILIQSLIQAIKNITITSNAVSQTSKDALDVVATNFEGLLKP